MTVANTESISESDIAQSKLHSLTHLILTTALWGGGYYVHCTDGEIGVSVNCPRLHCRSMIELDFNAGHPALGPVFLTSKLDFIVENTLHKIPLYRYRNGDSKWQSDLLRFIQLFIMEGPAFDPGLIMILNDSKVYLFTQ